VSFATLSVGGNDVGFFTVMNACILRASNGLTDADCQRKIAQTSKNIADIIPKLNQLYFEMAEGSGLTDPNFKLYVLGYVHFFNDIADQCNGASFAYYKNSNNGLFLTIALRKSINGLVQ